MVIRKLLSPILDVTRIVKRTKSYLRYWRDWYVYSRMLEDESLLLTNAYPCLDDRTPNTPFDGHYFYQDIWAFKAIQSSESLSHVDVGSRVIFVGLLTAIAEVVFVDVRPLIVNLDNLNSRPGSILDLPFNNNTVTSLSCLHVAEHIGLGRYGDPLDPRGTEKACDELVRVLAPAGHLYFSVPVGTPRVCFNAHRIHAPQQILDYFCDLELVEFAGVTDRGEFAKNIRPDDLADSHYACGLFHFMKAL